MTASSNNEPALPASAFRDNTPTLPHQVSEEKHPQRGRILGDYELLEEIARGGMGIVYRARQISLNRLVAVKMILNSHLAAPDEVRRFHIEAEAAATLDHPNIVPIHEVGESQGEHYFSMKLIEGKPLASKSAENRTLHHPQTSARLVAVVARAVHYAHQRGILHRDLKPTNILVDSAGTPYITDFGLAKRLGSDRGLTQSGAILGTPEYMAPEQARAAKGLSVAVDVHALGAMLYELLTGVPPFRAPTPLETLLRVIDQPAPAPRDLAPQIAPDLETICLKCLEKDPQRRYPSAEALADDLERWLRGEPITARPVSRFERAWRWGRRNPTVASSLLATGLTLVAGTLVAVLLALEANAQRDRAEVLATQANASALSARRNLYAAHLNLLARAWEDCQIEVVADLLARQLPEKTGGIDLRGFEWFYWQHQLHSPLLDLSDQPHPLTAVVYSPDGRWFITASAGVPWRTIVPDNHPDTDRPCPLTQWDAATGKPIRTFTGHPAGVICLALTRDGKVLAAGGGVRGRNGVVTLWDTTTGAKLHDLSAHRNMVTSVSFTPAGDHLATASHENDVRLWDWKAAKVARRFTVQNTGFDWIQISPDGKTLVAAEDYGGVIHVWNLPSGQKHTLNLNGCPQAFSPDSQLLAVSCADATVRLVNVAQGKEVASVIGHRGTVDRAVFSSDGNRLATAGNDRTVRLWDGHTGDPLLTCRGHRNALAGLAFSPNGERLVSVSEGLERPPQGEIKVWDASRGQRAFDLCAGSEQIHGFALDSRGERLATHGRSGVLLRDACTGKELARMQGTPSNRIFRHMLFTARDRWVVVAEEVAEDVARERGVVTVWDARTGQEWLRVTGAQTFRRLACHPQRPWVALMSEGEVQIWDLERRERIAHSARGGKNLAWSPDGTTLALVRNQQVDLWDWEHARLLRTLGERVVQVAFAPNGQLLATATDHGDIAFWDLPDGQQRRTIHAHDEAPVNLFFSHDGQRLFSTEAELCVWDRETGESLLRLRNEGASQLGLSADGTRLYSLSSSLKVWDVGTPPRVRPR